MSNDLSISLSGAGAWPDLLGANGLLGIKIARWQRLAWLEPMTPGDAPEVGILGELQDGTRLYCHVGWAELYAAVQAIAAQHGAPPP
jgi:hypothetical protein